MSLEGRISCYHHHHHQDGIILFEYAKESLAGVCLFICSEGGRLLPL